METSGVNFGSLKTFLLSVKSWSNGPVSSRKWTQVELAQRLAFGGQTDPQVSSQVHASRKKRHFKADYPLFHWLVIG